MICQACQAWMAPQADARRRLVRCPLCGHQQPHRFLPLFIITGPSGAGKTAVLHPLQALLPHWNVFETDILWDSGGDWRMVFCNWLRIAESLAQRPASLPTILAGTILPEQIAECSSYPLFSAVHWLALLPAAEEQARRLRGRPAWRGWDEAKIAEQLRLAEWFRAHAGAAFAPPLMIVDTTSGSPAGAAAQIRDWALARWQGDQHNERDRDHRTAT